MPLEPKHVEYVIERSLRIFRHDDALWPAERRRTYLLVEDVEIPVSIDARVLPTARDDETGRHCRAVVATIAAGSATLLENQGRVLNEAIDTEQHERLGFDVCDDARTSALANFGRSLTERDDLARRWGATLNDHHLFATWSDANEFRQFANQRYPEHAPFNVLGLYVPRK